MLRRWIINSVIYAYLSERGVVDQCMPECVRDVFSFNRLVPRNSTWCKMQGKVFYRDAEKTVQHKHYSQLNTPIISLGASVVAPH